MFCTTLTNICFYFTSIYLLFALMGHQLRLQPSSYKSNGKERINKLLFLLLTEFLDIVHLNSIVFYSPLISLNVYFFSGGLATNSAMSNLS